MKILNYNHTANSLLQRFPDYLQSGHGCPASAYRNAAFTNVPGSRKLLAQLHLPLLVMLVAVLLVSPKTAAAQAVADTAKGRAFIAAMSTQNGYSQQDLQSLFAQVYMDADIIRKITRPAEKTMTWQRYRKIFMDKQRIDNGVKFYLDNEAVLDEAYEIYGVPQAVIVAILGVETRYGKVMGNDSVLTALATIAFGYPKREKFFTKELREFLQMAAEENIDPQQPLGSYAGAMGMAQFMPSSYRHYAVDYEGDGKRDLWHNPNDAIFSIANYLHKNGWQRDEVIVDEAELQSHYRGKYAHKPFTSLAALAEQGVYPKYRVVSKDSPAGMLQLDGENGKIDFITFANFAAITTYNTSPLYAMAVTELSLAIEASLW